MPNTNLGALLRVERANLRGQNLPLLLLTLLTAVAIPTGLAPVIPFFMATAALSFALLPWVADQGAGVMQFYGSLPVTRRQVVASHYRWALLGLCGSALGTVAASLVAERANPAKADCAFWITSLICLLVLSVLIAVVLPVRARWGSTGWLPVVAVTIGLGVFVCQLLNSKPGSTRLQLLPGGPYAWLGVSMVLAAAAWAISYAVTQRVYARCDF